jgi:hypothetical protein
MMKLSLPPKLVEKLLHFVKILFPVRWVDAQLCRNWPFSLPNRMTLRITLQLILRVQQQDVILPH